MKITICGGTHEASYIINMFKCDKKNKHKLIVINEDKEYGKHLANKYKIPVLIGDYTKIYTLDDADISNSDLFITLSKKDPDNYIASLLAKNLFNCKKILSVVTNPNNVSIFKRLGIDFAISSSYLIGETIKNESNIEDVLRTLSLEDDMIKIIEIDIKKEYEICDKELRELDFPEYGTISAIFRKPRIIIPKGKTDIRNNDKLIMVAPAHEEKNLINYVTKLKKQKKSVNKEKNNEAKTNR